MVIHSIFSNHGLTSEDLINHVKSDKFTEQDYLDLMSNNIEEENDEVFGKNYSPENSEFKRALLESPHNNPKNNRKILEQLSRKVDKSKGYRDRDVYVTMLAHHKLDSKDFQRIIDGEIKGPIGYFDDERDDPLDYVKDNPGFNRSHLHSLAEKRPDKLVDFIENPNFDEKVLDSALSNPEFVSNLSKDHLETLSDHAGLTPKHAENILEGEDFKGKRTRDTYHKLLDKLSPEKRKDFIDRSIGLKGGQKADDTLEDEDNWDNWQKPRKHNEAVANMLGRYKDLDEDQIEHIKRHGSITQKMDLFHNDKIDPKHAGEMYDKWVNDDSHHGYDLEQYNEHMKEKHELGDTQSHHYEQAEVEERENYPIEDYVDDYHKDLLHDMDEGELIERIVNNLPSELGDYDSLEDHPGYEKALQKVREEVEADAQEGNYPDHVHNGYSDHLSESDSVMERAVELADEEAEDLHLNPKYIPQHIHSHPTVAKMIEEAREKEVQKGYKKAEQEEAKDEDFLSNALPKRNKQHEYGEGLHSHEMVKDYADANNGSIDVGTMNKLHPNLKEEWKKIFGDKGKLSSNEVKEKIDQIPKQKYNLSYKKWGKDKMQNINSQDQAIFRLDHSPESYEEIKKDPAVYDTFNKVQDISQRSGHPTNKNTIAWARVDTTDPKHWMVDEVQSDFGSTVRDYLKKEGNEEKAGHIKTIEDAHKDWRENIMNSIIKAGKAHGVEKISTHSPESKSAHTDSGNVHSVYEHSYKKVPRRMGFKPSQAHELPLTASGKETFNKQSGNSFDADEYNQGMDYHQKMAHAHSLEAAKEGAEPHHAELANTHFNTAKKYQAKIGQIDPTHEANRVKLTPTFTPKPPSDDNPFEPDPLEHLHDYRDTAQEATKFHPYNNNIHESLNQKNADTAHQGHTLDLRPQFFKKHLMEVEYEDLIKNEIFVNEEFLEDLIKSPMATLESEDEREDFSRGLGYDGLDESLGEKHLATYKVPWMLVNGQKDEAFHHVIQNPNGEITHLLSHEKDPKRSGVGRITGNVTRGNVFTVDSSGLKPGSQGRGNGKILYQSALNHHGNMESDEALSPDSSALWNSLGKNPDNQVHLGTSGTNERHFASVKNHPNNQFEEQVKIRTAIKKSEKKFKQKIPGGLADKKKPSDFDKEALKEGIKVEMEHTSDPKIAEEIAADHLTEDLQYYKKLKTIEKSNDLEKGERGYWEKEGYSLKHSTDGAIHYINAYDKTGNHVGEFQFSSDSTGYEGKLMPLLSEVEVDHQRKGIASAAYKLAENKSGLQISPSPSRTPSSRALWNQPNKPFGQLNSHSKPKDNINHINTDQNTTHKLAASEHIESDLEKGALRNMAGVAAMTASLASAPTHNLFKEKDPTPIEKQVSIHPDLKIISMIESSGGQNKNHAQTTVGLNRGHTAGGATGLMPITIQETLKKNPKLASKYPNLVNMKHDELTEHINSNPNDEIDIANHHWERLGKIFGNNSGRKAYAWRNGITASKRATPQEIEGHDYVRKFKKYSNPTEGSKFKLSLTKSEAKQLLGGVGASILSKLKKLDK